MSDYLIEKETLTNICNQIRFGFGIVPQEHPLIRAEFIETDDGDSGTLVPDSVIQTYYMSIDGPGTNTNGNVTEYPRVGSMLAYRYKENNEGNVVPVLYYDRQDYGEPDWYQPMYYAGTEEIDGELCDKWRALQLGNNDVGEQPGESDYVNWDSPGQIYYYTNQIVEASAPMEYYSPTEIPDKLDELFITPKGQLMKCNVIPGIEIEKNSYVKLSSNFGQGSISNTASAVIEGVYKLSETKVMIFYHKKVQVDYDLNLIVATLSEGKVTFKTYNIAQEYSTGSAAVLVLNSNTFLLVKADSYHQSFHGQIYSIDDNGITHGTLYTIANEANITKSFLHKLNQNKAVLIYDKEFAVLTLDSSTKAISVSHTKFLSEVYGTITSIGVTDNNKLWVLDNEGDGIRVLCYLITDSSIVLLKSLWLTEDDEIEYSYCYGSLISTSDGKIIVASSWKETDMYDGSTWYSKCLRALYYNAETDNILLKNYALFPSTSSSMMENPKMVNIDNNSTVMQWGLSPYTLALMTHKNVKNSYTLTSTSDQEYDGFPIVLGNNSILVFHSGSGGIYYHSFYIFDEATIIQHNNEPGIYASLASYYDNSFDGIAKTWGDDTEPILAWVKNAEKWQ